MSAFYASGASLTMRRAGSVKGDPDGGVVVAQAAHYRTRLTVLAAHDERCAKNDLGACTGLLASTAIQAPVSGSPFAATGWTEYCLTAITICK